MLRTFPDYAIIFLATWYYAIRNNLWSPRMQTHMTNCIWGGVLEEFLYGEAPPRLSTPYPLKYHPGVEIVTHLYTSSKHLPPFYAFEQEDV